jgi:hypothetical protein
MQEGPRRFERKEFIDGLPDTLPISVIIDDEDTALNEQRIQAAQLVPGAFIPIRIQPYYCDLSRRVGGQRFENVARHDPEPVDRVPGAVKVGSDDIEGCDSPEWVGLVLLVRIQHVLR